MKPILFKAKCIDSRYGYEDFFGKTIYGYGIEQIIMRGELLECRLRERYSQNLMVVDPSTLVMTTL